MARLPAVCRRPAEWLAQSAVSPCPGFRVVARYLAAGIAIEGYLIVVRDKITITISQRHI
jgi:hypothetical protein